MNRLWRREQEEQRTAYEIAVRKKIDDTAKLYHHTGRLWLIVPVLLLWLSHVWMLASRGEMHDDPVVWAITSRRSLLMGVLMALVVGWAM